VNARSGRTFKAILLATAVLLAGNAFASSKGSLELQHPTNVAGKQLASGTYSVRWDGNGEQVQVKFFQGKNEVASAPARMVEVAEAPQNNSAVVNTNSDGSYSLAEIRFGGKKYALQITNDAGSSGASGSR